MKMKSINLILAFVFGILSLGAQEQGFNSKEDEKLIRETIQMYFDGWMTGDTSKIGKAMHTTCHLKFMRNDKFEVRDRTKYLSGFKPRPKLANSEGRIVKINSTRNTASAKCEIEIPGRLFTDYFNLMKFGNRWYIMDKIATNIVIKSNELADDKKAELDKVFAGWDDPSKPGGAAAVLHKGKVIYQKAFGTANMEHQTLITPTSKFAIETMSKHFTAFAVLLLEEKGKISLQDDVRKYLPELPDYGKKITLEHLLTHTSGLPEYWTAKWLSGWEYDDVFTKKDALKLAANFKTLNHEPGEAYMFNSMNISLLAEVVTRASGQTFAAFTKENIFDPLQMNNTLFQDDHKKIISNKAMPYLVNEEEYDLGTLNNVDVGPVAMYTCIEDMCRWEENFKSLKVGTSATLQKMNQKIILKNGKTAQTSAGILTYGQEFMHPERGVDKIYQTAEKMGYASCLFKFPAQEYTAIVLSNSLDYNGHLGMQAVGVFVEDAYTLPANIGLEQIDEKKLSRKELESYAGYYWDEQGIYSRQIHLKNDTLRYLRENYGRESLLIPLGDHKFQMLHPGDENIWLEFKEKGSQQLIHGHINDFEYKLTSYEKAVYTKEQLPEFAGIFYNEDLGIAFTVSAKEDKLSVTSNHHEEIEYHLFKTDHFWSHSWYFGGIQFERDANKKIIGFRLQQEGIRGVLFKKI